LRLSWNYRRTESILTGHLDPTGEDLRPKLCSARTETKQTRESFEDVRASLRHLLDKHGIRD